MRSIQAIFFKQVRDVLRNKLVLIQFIIMPAVAFIMTELVAKADPTIPDGMFVAMFAPMFAGMTLLTATAGAIAEDIERKSLRLLVMAGVKPHAYLLGVGGVFLLAGAAGALVFGLMGRFEPMALLKFVAALLLGSAASAVLGAAIGIVSKNQQAAVALGMPVAMVLAFGPMITMFNETVKKIFGVLYTQQISIVVNDPAGDFGRPLLIMLANIAVLAALFALAYKKKGLRNR